MGSGVFTRVWPYDDIQSAICSIYTLSTTRFKNREREKKRREREREKSYPAIPHSTLCSRFQPHPIPFPPPSHLVLSPVRPSSVSLNNSSVFLLLTSRLLQVEIFFWLEKIRTSKNIQQHCLLLLRGEREQNGSKGLRASSGKNRSEDEGMKRIRQALWS